MYEKIRSDLKKMVISILIFLCILYVIGLVYRINHPYVFDEPELAALVKDQTILGCEGKVGSNRRECIIAYNENINSEKDLVFFLDQNNWIVTNEIFSEDSPYYGSATLRSGINGYKQIYILGNTLIYNGDGAF